MTKSIFYSYNMSYVTKTISNLIENFFIAAHSNHFLIKQALDKANIIFIDYDNLYCKKLYDTCLDIDLSEITHSNYNNIVKQNIENDTSSVNEIFSPCPFDSSLNLGSDPLIGNTWMLE